MLAFDRHDGGDDGTLVLLHSLALDRSVWDGFLPHVRDRFEAIALDLPNHGKSPGLENPTIEAMGEAVADLIRDEVDGPAIVIGLSLGGCVAQAVAAHHPDTARGLGLLDTTAWYGEDAAERWESRARKAVEDGLASLADYQIERWFTTEFRARHPDVGERLLKVFRSNDLVQYVATCRAMGAADLRDVVGRIQVPTAVVVGAQDGATPPSHSWDLYQRIPGAGLHIIPDCSHLSATEHPGTVSALLDADLFRRL